MKKYNLSKIMKRAWEIKNEDSNNIFSICLKMAWDEAKGTIVEEYLLTLGLSTWEKYDKRRVYIDDLSVVNIEKYTPNPKAFRKTSIYFDVKSDTFFMNGVTSSRESTISELLTDIRKEANASFIYA